MFFLSLFPCTGSANFQYPLDKNSLVCTWRSFFLFIRHEFFQRIAGGNLALTPITEVQNVIRQLHFLLSASGYGQKSEEKTLGVSGYTSSRPISKISTNIKPYVPAIILYWCIRNLPYYFLKSTIAGVILSTDRNPLSYVGNLRIKTFRFMLRCKSFLCDFPIGCFHVATIKLAFSKAHEYEALNSSYGFELICALDLASSSKSLQS